METTAGPRKRQHAASASGSAAPYLPVELVRDILLWLPSRSVRRFRAVCKQWLRIVSHPEFAVEHHLRQPTLPLVSFLRGAGSQGSTDPVDCCVDAFDLRADRFRSVVRFTDNSERCGSSFHIHGSCDGLLLLSFEHRFYVCNPSTHQWTPVLLRGSLHWMPRQTPQSFGILAFNTATEVFRVMYPPVLREHMSLPRWSRSATSPPCSVAAARSPWSSSGFSRTIYENEIWVCMHRIRLPVVKVSTFPFDRSWRMFFMSEEGVVMVTTEQKLLHYDMDGTLLESLPCNNGRSLKITAYTFKESLVRHAFFERQDCNGDDDHGDEPEPPPTPFFQGL